MAAFVVHVEVGAAIGLSLFQIFVANNGPQGYWDTITAPGWIVLPLVLFAIVIQWAIGRFFVSVILHADVVERP